MTEEDVKVIETILGQLRRTTGYAINIEVKYLRADTSYLAGLRKQGDGSIVYLSDKAEQKLLEDAAKKKDVEVVASSEVIAANDQVVHIREGQQVSMLMDYDINTVGIPTLQPVVKLVNEGLICQFRPVVFHGGREVSLDVMASLSKIRKEVRKGEFLGGELMFPAMEMSRLRTSVQVPSGKAVLVGGVAKSSGIRYSRVRGLYQAYSQQESKIRGCQNAEAYSHRRARDSAGLWRRIRGLRAEPGVH